MTAKNTKKSISLRQAILEAVTDSKGNRKCNSVTFRPEDTHLNIEVLPDGVSNAEELISWYKGQLPKTKKKITRKVKDKKTGQYKEQTYEKTTVYSNAVPFFSGSIKPPCEVMKDLSYEDQLQYFYDALEIVGQILQEGNRRCTIQSFQIHFDEGMEQGEPHCHYQGIAMDAEGNLGASHTIDVLLNEQLNYTFCLRMQEKGWPVKTISARPQGEEYQVTEDMTPEEKRAVRQEARHAQIEERKRRGTLNNCGLDTNQYAHVKEVEREAKAKAEQKAHEAKAEAAKKADAAEDTMDEAIELQADANEKVWKAEQKETELNQIQSNLNAKETQLDSRENALIKRERVLKQAFDWMQNTFELEGTRHSMSVWDFYQESLGTRSSKSETKNTEVKEAPKPAEKVVEKKQAEERNKQMQEMEKAMLASEAAWNESTSENKKRYTKQQFKKLWVATQDYRAELDRATMTKIVLGSKDVPVRDDNQFRIQKNAEKVLTKYASKHSGEELLFGIVEIGLKLPKELIAKFVEGFKEGYAQARKPESAQVTKQEIHDDVKNEINEIAAKENVQQKTVERREHVNRELIDDKYKSQRDIQIGV